MSKPSNDNKWPPIPVPRGGFRTNLEEAKWLEATIIMRMREALAEVGINASAPEGCMLELLLLSLDAASKRGIRHDR